MPFPFPSSWDEDFTGWQGEPLSKEEIKRLHLDEMGKIWGKALALKIDRDSMEILKKHIKGKVGN